MPDISDTFITTDANGNIGANFSGHIAAAGVDLTAATSASQPSDRKVRWLKASNGALIAEIYGVENLNGGSGLNLRAWRDNAGFTAHSKTELDLTAAVLGDNTSNNANLLLQDDQGGSVQTFLLNQAGGSSYVQNADGGVTFRGIGPAFASAIGSIAAGAFTNTAALDTGIPIKASATSVFSLGIVTGIAVAAFIIPGVLMSNNGTNYTAQFFFRNAAGAASPAFTWAWTTLLFV